MLAFGGAPITHFDTIAKDVITYNLVVHIPALALDIKIIRRPFVI